MSIEDELNEFEISQPSELQGMARELFSDDKDANKIDQKTNLIPEEVSLCMVNDIIFDSLGMTALSPTSQFKRLASSRKGWKTEAFVRAAQSTNEARGGGMMDRLGGMLQPKR